MTPTTPTVTVYGWELRYVSTAPTGRGSDKYYRVLVLDPVVLINYGRSGTGGQFIAHSFRPGRNGALEKARAMTNEKAERAYSVSLDMTKFEVPESLARGLTDLPIGSHRGLALDVLNCDRIVQAFRASAHAQAGAHGASTGVA